jgi:hypothetical protein
LLVVLLLAVIDMGRYMFTVQAMLSASQAAARIQFISNQRGGYHAEPQLSQCPGLAAPNLDPPLVAGLDGTQLLVCFNFAAVPSTTVTVAMPFLAFTPGLGFLANIVQSSDAQACGGPGMLGYPFQVGTYVCSAANQGYTNDYVMLVSTAGYPSY